jgi:hypothetical protein
MKHITNNLRHRLARSRATFYLLAFVILLTLVAMMGCLTNCDCDSDDQANTSSGTSQSQQLPAHSRKLTVGVLTPHRMNGDTYRFGFVGCASGPPFPATVKVTWSPPEGATNFTFYDDPKPDNPAGPPPFVWSNWPVDQNTGKLKTANVTLYYDYHDPYLKRVQVNTVTLESGGEQASGAGRGTMEWLLLTDQPANSATIMGSGESGGKPPTRDTALRLDDPYYLWQVNQWFYTDGGTMSASRCQDWRGLLQSDQVFLALRFPIYPPTLSYTESYTLPVVFRGPYSPTLTLWDTRGPTVRLLTVPLELRAMRHTFLENELPLAEGEGWVALGVATTPTVDCSGLPTITDGRWEFEADLYLDLGGTPEAGQGVVLPFYYCYEGQSPPGPLVGRDVTSYQGWNTTCLGPHYLTLRDGPGDWELAGMANAWITPTQTISFPHTLYNWTVTPPLPLTFTLEATSTLPAGWAFYADPQGQTPLVGPVRVDDVLEFWVFGQAPAGAADGPYNLFVTARTGETLPASQQAADLLWVGDWVAPPLPFQHRAYLPLVVRSSQTP